MTSSPAFASTKSAEPTRPHAPGVAPSPESSDAPSARTVLASPLRLRSGVVLPNRLAKAAMSEVLANGDGSPSERLIRLYERWGRGGAGLLVTGHVIVDRSGIGEPGNVVLEDERHLPALRRWAEAAQANGSRVFVQLNHAGRQSPRRVTPEPLAPAAVALRGFGGLFARPRALLPAEVEQLVEKFATSAVLAKEAGFAGVQIHAAHGYLISQFLSPRVNLRDDAWGGDAKRRRAFLLAIVRRTRERVGSGFPIAVKLNSADFQRGGFTFEEAMDVARALEDEGIDLLEVSGGNYESPAMAGSGELPKATRASTREREAYFLEYAKGLRAVTTTPIVLTGGMRSADVMRDAILSGAVDIIGMARPLAFDPDLPRRILDGGHGATPVKVHTGIRKVDDMLQIFWFQSQIHRMANGLEPDPELGRFRALLAGVRDTIFAARAHAAAGAPTEDHGEARPGA
jgi:2,4-dienoyl-CoA reductase-like NADH-dependent reductase (Old Yellow Enzyme family)